MIAAVLTGVWFGVGYMRQRAALSHAPPKTHHAGRAKVTVVEPSHSPAPNGASPGPSLSPLPSTSPGPPRIAIIIDDCGNDFNRCNRFIQMPVPLTVAILPLTPHGRDIANAAVAAGQSVMLHLPMQPESDTHNPGPGAITTSMTDEQIATQVEADLASLPPVPGGNNHMGSKGTSDPRVMRDVLAVFKKDHLFFIDSETTNTSVGEQIAKALGVRTAARSVFLDNEIATPAIEDQLRAAQAVALKTGQAIAIGHPNPETAEAIEKMIPEMVGAGVTFVRAETLVR